MIPLDSTESQSTEANEGGTIRQPRKLLQIIVQNRIRRVRKVEFFEKGEMVIKANGSAQSIKEWSKKSRLDEHQRTAFEIIISSFILTFFDDLDATTKVDDIDEEKKKLKKLADTEKRESEQLIALLHGPGGSGKSWVIDLVLAYGKEFCGFNQNFVFDKRTILVTATTGCAATLLTGETVHRALKLYCNLDQLDEDEKQEWTRTRLIIIDEISFANKNDMEAIDKNLHRMCQNASDQEFFGGKHIVFAGDFRQLDPIGKEPLYATDYKLEHKVNCYLELRGNHRFKDDPEWGDLLKRFRDGTIRTEDIQELNKQISLKTQNMQCTRTRTEICLMKLCFGKQSNIGQMKKILVC